MIISARNKGFKKAEILPVSKTGYFRVSAESFSDITLAKKLRDILIKLKYKDAWILKMASQKGKLDPLTGIKKANKTINSKNKQRLKLLRGLLDKIYLGKMK